MQFPTKVVLAMILSLTALAGCGGGDKAPVADVRPHEMTIHGDTRVDNYFWLNDREDPEVIAHLEAENAYLKKTMAHTEDLQADLFEEMKGRIKEDDSSAPYEKNGKSNF
jgi:oligopeptidase B